MPSFRFGHRVDVSMPCNQYSSFVAKGDTWLISGETDNIYELWKLVAL